MPLSHKAWAWFEANKQQALWAPGGVLVLGVIVAFFLYRQNEADVAASEALSSVSMPQLAGAGSRTDPAEAYLKVAAAYPNSRAGARAMLLAAGSLFVEGKYPDAKTQFERFTASTLTALSWGRRCWGSRLVWTRRARPPTRLPPTKT